MSSTGAALRADARPTGARMAPIEAPSALRYEVLPEEGSVESMLHAAELALGTP